MNQPSRTLSERPFRCHGWNVFILLLWTVFLSMPGCVTRQPGTRENGPELSSGNESVSGAQEMPAGASGVAASSTENVSGSSVSLRGEPSPADDGFMDYWLEQAATHHAFSIEEIARNVDLAPELKMALPESRHITRPEKAVPLPTEKITLIMRDAGVGEIFQALARTVNQNILVSKGVEGVMSVELRDVAWDEAFTGLLQNLGLHYLWTGKIIRVLTVDEFRSALELEKLEKERQQISQEMKHTETLILQTVDIHYADAEKLAKICEELLTSAQTATAISTGEKQYVNLRGSVGVDKENNALVIHAIRDDIMKMLDVIEKLDRPKKQVLIQARIIVASRETARELGMQWGGVGRIGSGWVYPGTDTTGVLGSTAGSALAPVAGNISNFPATSVTGTSSSTGTTGTTGTSGTSGTTDTTGNTVSSITGMALGYALQSGDNYLLNIQLSALESAGKAHILASPSITTLDNQEAILKSGSEIPYQSYSENEGTEIEFKEALLELRVCPHIIGQRMVRLEINASNDEPDYSRVESGTMTEPAISRRSAQTNVLLYDGETTVIGGLSTSYGNDTKSGVPWLKDIPWLGVLFRSDAKEERQEDMLIFITPYVLNDRPPSPRRPELNGPAEGNSQNPADEIVPPPAQTDPTQTRKVQ